MAVPAVVGGRLRAALAALILGALAACGDGGGSPTVSSGATTTGAIIPTTVAATPTTARLSPASTTPLATTAIPTTVLAVTVRGGSVVDGASRQRATLNQPVTIRVTSDVADEVHVHGFEKRFDVAAGRTGEVTFVANIPGVFEVEFEKSHKLLFTLEVR